jgi:hypothetical protein
MSIPVFHPRYILPRQCGKTTLARAVGDSSGYAYISFDSDVLRASVQADPVVFVVDLPDKAVLNEVQRVPARSENGTAYFN